MARRSDSTAWDPLLSKFFEHMSESGQVKVKQASEVGTRRVDYFRGADFARWIQSSRGALASKFPELFQASGIDVEQEIEEIGQKLLRHGFVSRAQYQPVEGTSDATSANGILRRPKWPKRLGLSPKQVFDENQFYIVHYDGRKWKHYIIMVLILIAVLGVCMFNAWPIFAKIFIWYLTVIFMTIALTICAVRLVVFVMLWFVGFDCWIFPNLFDEERGVIDSFRPLLKFDKRQDGWWMLAARMFCAVLFAASIYQLGKTHSVADVGNFTKQSFLDVIEWGTQKLTALPEVKNPYPSVIDIERQSLGDESTGDEKGDEESWNCLQACGYNTFEVARDQCLIHCKCATELCENPCLEKCSENIKSLLLEYKIDSCQQEQQRKDRKKK